MECMELVDEMAYETTKMVQRSIDAYVKKDVRLAEEVVAQDDIVDDYFSKIKHDIISMIAEKSADGELALDFLMIHSAINKLLMREDKKISYESNRNCEKNR